MLRIVSLNAWGGRLHEPLLNYLVARDADIVCLQEVTRTHRPPDCQCIIDSAAAPSPWLVYRDDGIELPQRANLFDEIVTALPGHEGRFMPASRGPLWDGDRAVMSEFGLATFIRRTLPAVEHAEGFVHGAFSPDGWGEHPRPRNAHVFRLMDTDAGFTVTIAQMHGLRDPAGKQDTPERMAQAEALVRLIGEVRPSGEPLVVCGDFNVLPDSATFTSLARLCLADLVTGRGHTDTRTSWYQKPGRFADYMLVSEDVAVVSFDVVAAPEVSDHRALDLLFG